MHQSMKMQKMVGEKWVDQVYWGQILSRWVWVSSSCWWAPGCQARNRSPHSTHGKPWQGVRQGVMWSCLLSKSSLWQPLLEDTQGSWETASQSRREKGRTCMMMPTSEDAGLKGSQKLQCFSRSFCSQTLGFGFVVSKENHHGLKKNYKWKNTKMIKLYNIKIEKYPKRSISTPSFYLKLVG